MERADRALARPRPARLRGDGALRADQLARAARARRPALPRRPERSTCRRTWPRTAPRCSGCASCFPEARSYLDVYAARRPAAREAASSRTASGSTTPTAPRSPRPARRSRTARRRTCSSAAACSTGAPAATPASHVSLASDVGGGTSLSMLRNMADAYKVQALRRRAPDRVEGAARGDARRGASRSASPTRSARSSPARSADVCVWDSAVGPVATRRADGGAHLA